VFARNERHWQESYLLKQYTIDHIILQRNKLWKKYFTTVSNSIDATSFTLPCHSSTGSSILLYGFTPTRVTIDIQPSVGLTATILLCIIHGEEFSGKILPCGKTLLCKICIGTVYIYGINIPLRTIMQSLRCAYIYIFNTFALQLPILTQFVHSSHARHYSHPFPFI